MHKVLGAAEQRASGRVTGPRVVRRPGRRVSVVAGSLKYKGLNVKKESAVGLALITLLQNDDVRKALGGAGAGLTAWSKRTRARFDAPLTDRYGQGALLHRIDALATV